jgi:hypothetical protein
MPVTPVTFAPGRLRLVTSPISIGFALTAKTIGVFAAAALAACAAGLPKAVINVTRRSTRSAARPRQTGVIAFRGMIFDAQVLVSGKAFNFQSFVKRQKF